MGQVKLGQCLVLERLDTLVATFQRIQITVDTYGHLMPGANRGAVNRLDDAAPMQPSATQAQPDALHNAGEDLEDADLFEESGEPRWNRTINPQIKSLLLCQLS